MPNKIIVTRAGAAPRQILPIESITEHEERNVTEVTLGALPTDLKFLVFSAHERLYWRAEGHGATENIDEAHRYSQNDAFRLMQWHNPSSGDRHDLVITLIPAPED